MVFLVDTAMSVKTFFDNWMNMVIDDRNTNDVSFSNDYCSDIKIFQLDHSNADVIHTITLRDAYPKMMDAMQLNHRSQDLFHTLSVTFVYTKIIYETTALNPAAMQTNVNDISTVPTENNPFGAPQSQTSDDFFGSSFNQLSSATNGIRNQIMDTVAPIVNAGYAADSVMNQTRSFLGSLASFNY
jgi:hypothetical protein